MDAALAAGAARLGPAVLAPVRQGILAHRQEDGGFAGRAGGSDPWYTAFALRGLELTGGIPTDLAAAAAAWLARQAPPSDHRAALDHATIAVLTRTPVATWPAFPPPQDAYAAFAAAMVADLLGRSAPTIPSHLPADQVPTVAAALIARRLTGALSASARSSAIAFLLGRQQLDGGLAVHAGAPVSDLLSTATAAWALAACRRLHRLDAAGLARFVVSCRRPDGFGALPGDAASDPEYAWYGLALLALLRRHAASGPVGWLRRRGWWMP
jgi:geranylgeranyl transferase type-2 subunit beta